VRRALKTVRGAVFSDEHAERWPRVILAKHWRPFWALMRAVNIKQDLAAEGRLVAEYERW